ncbi:MAG: CmpA/NrtA family ABC transporter substrate-binding protein [Verrucomicrobiota bacterium]
MSPHTPVPESTPGAPLRLGFLPVCDCAPLIFAFESGLFGKYELAVELVRESKWDQLRDKLMCRQLDAVEAPCSLPFVSNLTLESDQCAAISGMILSLQGNSIILSRHLRKEGVRDAASLRDLVFRDWGRRTYTFAVSVLHSPAHFLLNRWLRIGDLDPHVQVRIVALPPDQMFPTLKLGYIDGFCVGEPWTSLAIEAGAGTSVATSSDLAPLHPEKLLMVRRDFSESRAAEHERLIAALLESCAFCDRPENAGLLSEILSQPHYLNAPADCLKRALSPAAAGQAPAVKRSRAVFCTGNANDPTDEKAAWIMENLYDSMDLSPARDRKFARTPVFKNILRRDIYENAVARVASQATALKQEADAYAATIQRVA